MVTGLRQDHHSGREKRANWSLVVGVVFLVADILLLLFRRRQLPAGSSQTEIRGVRRARRPAVDACGDLSAVGVSIGVLVLAYGAPPLGH